VRYAALGARSAARVDAVLPDSAAAEAGMQTGDVIVAVGGEPVEDVPTFAAAIAAREGATELTVLRNGKQRGITVDLQPE
jgi:S1-C subfamily serine protease